MKDQIDDAIQRGKIIFLGTKLPEDWYAGFVEWKHAWDTQKKPDALYNVAYCYGYGKGVLKDVSLSTEYYKEAIRLGNKQALERLYWLGVNNDTYQGLQYEERLQKDAVYRDLIDKMAANGNKYALRVQPFFNNLTTLRLLEKEFTSPREWEAFDKFLSDKKFDGLLFADVCKAARELEVHFTHKTIHGRSSTNTGAVNNGNTVYSTHKTVPYETRSLIKNISSKPLPGYISFGQDLGKLKPGETVTRRGEGSRRNKESSPGAGLTMTAQVGLALGLNLEHKVIHEPGGDDSELVKFLVAPVNLHIAPKILKTKATENSSLSFGLRIIIGLVIIFVLYKILQATIL